MRLILMLLVAIAALNIISGLVMLVKNKGRDIAILRTMGAGQGAILRIFFMAGATIGVLGTAGGPAAGRAVLRSTSTRSRASWSGSPGQAVFSSDVYFLSRLPAKVDWVGGGGDHLLRRSPCRSGHPAAGLARLAPRSGGGASL